MVAEKLRISDRIEEAREEVAEITPMLGRPEEHRIKTWMLLTGDRRTMSALLAGIVFASIFALSMWQYEEMFRMFRETDTVQTLLNTLLSGVILLVSVVVSINSVALTQELGSLGTQRERVKESNKFRERLQELLEEHQNPTNPSEILQALLQHISEEAYELQETASNSHNEQFAEEVETYVEKDIFAHIRRINEQFKSQQVGMFDVLIAGMSYDYATQLQLGRRIREEFSDALAEQDEQAMEELFDSLQSFAVVHRYFKTLYYQHETSDLSTVLLYTSLPAILFSSYVLLALDANLFPQIVYLQISPLLVFISLAYTVLLVPFIVLTVYMIRLATVTKRTLSSGSFLANIRTTGRIDWKPIKGVESD